MKEYKVGEKIELEVQETKAGANCFGCIFDENGLCCVTSDDFCCSAHERSDGKNVIFVEKGK